MLTAMEIFHHQQSYLLQHGLCKTGKQEQAEKFFCRIGIIKNTSQYYMAQWAMNAYKENIQSGDEKNNFNRKLSIFSQQWIEIQ